MSAAGRPVRRGLRAGLIVVVVVAVVGAAAAATLRVAGADAGTGNPQAVHVSTAKVVKKTLVDSLTVDGTIAYGAATPVTSRASGTVTWMPTPGTVISRGQPLLRADNQPIVLLYGAIPMYRELALNAEGDDVKQLKDNLGALSIGKVTSGAKFDKATEDFVKKWQKALKRSESGKVAVGDVIYAAGPLRVEKQSVRVGAAATADVLTATATKRVVTLAVPAGKERLAKVHNAVTVTLPDGKQVKGEVTSVGADPAAAAGQPDPSGKGPASDAQNSDHPIPAIVDVADQGALGKADSGTVRVEYVADTHADVLTVPVEALVALGEGGFGLEIRGGGTPRVVAVKVGLFGGGQVEVSGDGIAEGTTVGVAG